MPKKVHWTTAGRHPACRVDTSRRYVLTEDPQKVTCRSCLYWTTRIHWEGGHWIIDGRSWHAARGDTEIERLCLAHLPAKSTEGE
jgi:hypothetical protein